MLNSDDGGYIFSVKRSEVFSYQNTDRVTTGDFKKMTPNCTESFKQSDTQDKENISN